MTGLGTTGVLLIIAMALYPNYNQLEQTISKLGNIWPSSLFFSLALLVEVVTLSYLLSKLKRNMPILLNEYKTHLTLIYLLYSAMNLCIIGVVIFPSKGVTSDIHDIIAVTLFLLMAIATSWVSSILKSGLNDWNRNVTYLGYACTILVIILGYLMAFGEFGPVIQKITVFLFSCWVFLMVYEFQKYPVLKI